MYSRAHRELRDMSKVKLHWSRTLRPALIFMGILLLLLGLGAAVLVYGWTQFARSLPALQGWHLQSPPSEFRANRVSSDFNLDDYCAQEDRVFEELKALVDGPLVPHDILRVSGEEAVQQYLLHEIQQVYQSQKVEIRSTPKSTLVHLNH